MGKHRYNAIFCTLALLFLAGCGDHGVQGHGAKAIAEPSAVIPYDPLPSRSTSPIEAGIWSVVRIVDGDTLIVGDGEDRSKQYRIRLIGADAPELARGSTPAEPYANEATELVRGLISQAGGKVRLSFDGEQIDRYNRVLAMVYVQTSAGEVWLNELLIREGLAHARLDYRYSHGSKLAFAIAEVEARKQRRNLWSFGIDGIGGKQ